MLLSDDFLRTMIDQMPALAWSCRPDGSAEFVNQRWLDYTGLSMEEAVGWAWQATIHPEDLGKTMETWLRPSLLKNLARRKLVSVASTENTVGSCFKLCRSATSGEK